MKYMKFAFLLLVMGFAANAQERFIINGTISGDAEGKTLYLLKGADERSRSIVDSTIIKKGKFQFVGNLTMAGTYAIKIFKNKDRSFFTKDMKYIGRPHIPLFLSGGIVQIEANIDSLPLTAIKTNGYDYSKIRITGSKESVAFMQYVKGKTLLMMNRDSLHAQYKAYLDKRPNVSITEGLNVIEKIDAIDKKFKVFVKLFITNNSDNLAAVYALRETNLSSNVGVFSYNEINTLLSSFSTKLKETPLYALTAEEANEINKYAVGRRFTDADLVDASYKQVKLSDYVGKGKYVLIDFWGPQCIPCRKEFPFIKETYRSYHPDGFEIIGISVDKSKERWPKAMADENLPWKQFAFISDPTLSKENVRKYAYFSIPFSLLIGPDGTILDRNMMGSYMDRKLIEIYGNKFKE